MLLIVRFVRLDSNTSFIRLRTRADLEEKVSVPRLQVQWDSVVWDGAVGVLALLRDCYACRSGENMSGRRECWPGFSLVLVAWMLRALGCRGELSGDVRSSALLEDG